MATYCTLLADVGFVPIQISLLRFKSMYVRPIIKPIHNFWDDRNTNQNKQCSRCFVSYLQALTLKHLTRFLLSLSEQELEQCLKIERFAIRHQLCH
jgi:hypothetical protein